MPDKDEIPPARNPDIAVQEEYNAAIAANTKEALSLFIRRHPDHALADKARAKLAKLK